MHQMENLGCSLFSHFPLVTNMQTLFFTIPCEIRPFIHPTKEAGEACLQAGCRRLFCAGCCFVAAWPVWGIWAPAHSKPHQWWRIPLEHIADARSSQLSGKHTKINLLVQAYKQPNACFLHDGTRGRKIAEMSVIWGNDKPHNPSISHLGFPLQRINIFHRSICSLTFYHQFSGHTTQTGMMKLHQSHFIIFWY